MNLSPRQIEFLRAIDSKDFGNVAEYLLDNGPVCFPGLVFYFHADRVHIEHASKRGEKALCSLVAKFVARHGIRLVQDATERKRRVPTRPAFVIRHNPLLGES